MDFSIIFNLIACLAGIFSLIYSIANFYITKKDMKTKIELTNFNLTNNKPYIDEKQISSVSLEMICKYTESYFKQISRDNSFVVNIFKLNNTNNVILVASSSNIKNAIQYNIEDNTEFNEAVTTLEPYYKNNISYYHNHGNKYISEDKDWKKKYESIFCCPILNDNKPYGFLTVEIRNPLNDLVYIHEIIKFLKLECAIISKNSEFNNFHENGCNIDTFNTKSICQINTSQGCYQWEETVDVDDDD